MGTDNRGKILIYRLGSLGDMVVALPCFHLLARVFENKTRILLTNTPVHSKAPPASSVFADTGLVHGYLGYSVGSRNPRELSKLGWQIRRLGIESLVYLSVPRGEAAVKRDALFFRLCGVKEIIGIPLGDLGTHLYDPIAGRHEAEFGRLARCVAELGDPRVHDVASWDLLLTGKERARAENSLRRLQGAPFLAVGIGSKKSVTDWGIENWMTLMPKLHRRFREYALVFVGAKEDRPAIDEIADRWPGKFLNLGGDLSPRESAAVIERGDLFLGVDSGPMHLAASVGTPCVAIFSAHNVPGMWFPCGDGHEIIYHKTDCFGCDLDTCTNQKKKCILSISAEEVVAAAMRAMERKQVGVQRPGAWSSPGPLKSISQHCGRSVESA